MHSPLKIQSTIRSSLSLVALVASASCAQSPSTLDPLWASVRAAPCRYQLPAGQTEGSQVTCADVTVLEDEPGGPTVRLHIARFRSSASSNGNATLFLQGGPGTYVQSELSTLTPERLRALTANGDLIVFDQRGAGTATPALECEAVGRAATGPARTSALTACFEQYRSANIDVRAYDSEHIARDIEALRRALGLTQINLVARSYGTRVALEVLRRYESSVRAVVLDAPVAPDIATWAEQARNFEAGLRAFTAECAQTEACNQRYPAIDQQLLTAAQQLDTQPLSVDLGFAVVPLDGAAMLGAVDLALYRRETYPALPLIIDAARRRDAATLSATLREFVNPMTVSNAGASLGMNHVVTCNDSVQYFDDGAVAQAESGVQARIRQHFSSLYVSVVRDSCSAMRPVMRAGVAQAVRSSVPTLLLSGAIDPTVHTTYATHVAETLSRSASFTFTRVGHGAFETPCGTDLTARFLASADPTLDGSCATQTPAINFR